MYSALSWAASVFGQGDGGAALDVVAVRREDRVASSPWHVFVGSSPGLRGRELRVVVNGRDAGVRMRVGAAGVAYFERRPSATRSLSPSASRGGAQSKRTRSFSEGFLESEGSPNAAAGSVEEPLSQVVGGLEETHEPSTPVRRVRSYDNISEPGSAESSVERTWEWGEVPMAVPELQQRGALLLHRTGAPLPAELFAKARRRADSREKREDPSVQGLNDSDADTFASSTDDDLASSDAEYSYRPSLVPSCGVLRTLELRDGENALRFEMDGRPSISCRLFLGRESAQLVIAGTLLFQFSVNNLSSRPSDFDGAAVLSPYIPWSTILSSRSRMLRDDIVEVLS